MKTFLSVIVVMSAMTAWAGGTKAAKNCVNCKTDAPRGVTPDTVGNLGALAKDVKKVAEHSKDCLAELGKDAEKVVQCTNELYDNFYSPQLSFDEIDRRSKACAMGSTPAELTQNGALSVRALISRLATDQAGYVTKLAFGVKPDAEDMRRIDRLNKYNEAEAAKQGKSAHSDMLAAYKARAAQLKPKTQALLKAGVTVSSEGPDFSHFNFAAFKTDRKLQDALTAVYGAPITQSVLKLINDPLRANAVILGKTTLIPNQNPNPNFRFPTGSGGVTQIDTKAYNGIVQQHVHQLATLMKTYMQDTKKYSSYSETMNRTFGAATVTDEKIDKAGNEAVTTILELRRTLGIDPAQFKDINEKVSRGLKEGGKSLEAAVQAAERMDKGAKWALAAAPLGGLALWGAAAIGAGALVTGAATGAVTALGPMLLIQGAETVYKGYEAYKHGEGSLECYLGEQLAQQSTAFGESVPSVMAFGLVMGPASDFIMGSAAKAGFGAKGLAATRVGLGVGPGLYFGADMIKEAVHEHGEAKERDQESVELAKQGLPGAAKAAAREAASDRANRNSLVVQGFAFSGLVEALRHRGATPEAVKKVNTEVPAGASPAEVVAKLGVSESLRNAVETQVAAVEKTGSKSFKMPELKPVTREQQARVKSTVQEIEKQLVKAGQPRDLTAYHEDPRNAAIVNHVIERGDELFTDSKVRAEMIHDALNEGIQGGQLEAAAEVVDLMGKAKEKFVREGKTEAQAEAEVKKIVDEAEKSCALR